MSIFFAQFGAQSTNVHVDSSSATVILVTPDSTEQRFAREDAVGIRCEKAEQFVFHEREVHDSTSDEGLVRLKIDAESALFDNGGATVVAGTSQTVAKSRSELADV